MDRRDRAFLHNPGEERPMRGIELGRNARRGNVDEESELDGTIKIAKAPGERLSRIAGWSSGRRMAEMLSLRFTHEAFSLPQRDLEREYFDRFESICDEIRDAERRAIA
jgi:hypothetical protein